MCEPAVDVDLAELFTLPWHPLWRAFQRDYPDAEMAVYNTGRSQHEVVVRCTVGGPDQPRARDFVWADYDADSLIKTFVRSITDHEYKPVGRGPSYGPGIGGPVCYLHREPMP